MFFSAVDFRQRAGQTLHGTGAEHHLDKRIGLPEQCADLLLLCHAAAQPDDQPRVLFVDRLQCAEPADHAGFRMCAHGAGIEQDDIRILRRIGQLVAEILKDALVFFTVTEIELAPEALDMCTRRMRKGFQYGADLRSDLRAGFCHCDLPFSVQLHL